MMSATVQNVVHLPTLYKKQRDVFYSPARIVVCEATTKAGKTVGGLHWLAHYSLQDTEQRTRHWISPTFPEAEACFDRLCRWMLKADPAQKVWQSWRAPHPRIRLGKSFVAFKGADEPNRLYGPDSAGVVLDEASRMKEEAFKAARSTTTAMGSPMRIIGNVNGRKNWAYRMARKAESGEPGYAYFKLTAYDAARGFADMGATGNVINADKIEQAKRDYTEADFRQLYLAEASDDGANPFGLDHIAACVMPLSGDTPVVYGVDLAQKVDWTVAIGLDAHGRVSCFDRWQGVDWADTEERLALTIGNVPALIDETGVGAPVLDRLRRRGLNAEGFTFTSRSKQHLLAQLGVSIQQRRTGFPDGPIRNELEAIEFEHGPSGVKYASHDGSNDDCVMALALAVRKLDSVQHTPMVFVDLAVPTAQAASSGSVASVFSELRRDPDWGFDP